MTGWLFFSPELFRDTFQLALLYKVSIFSSKRAFAWYNYLKVTKAQCLLNVYIDFQHTLRFFVGLNQVMTELQRKKPHAPIRLNPLSKCLSSTFHLPTACDLHMPLCKLLFDTVGTGTKSRNCFTTFTNSCWTLPLCSLVTVYLDSASR